MNIKFKDVFVHMGASLLMMAVLLALPHQIGITLTVVAFWYGWELAQRITKDPESRGVLYWLNFLRWGDQSKAEFVAPAMVAISVLIIYVIITL
jgi:hypothetical protein